MDDAMCVHITEFVDITVVGFICKTNIGELILQFNGPDGSYIGQVPKEMTTVNSAIRYVLSSNNVDWLHHNAVIDSLNGSKLN